jgi:hypothetical protein
MSKQVAVIKKKKKSKEISDIPETGMLECLVCQTFG